MSSSPTPGSCAAMLRESDPDRYTACLYLPENGRDAGFALWTCRAELAGIAARIREPAAGEIRLRWWHEALSGERETGGHPVAEAVRAALQKHALPSAPLADAADAHIFDLYHDPMPDISSFERYAGETFASFLMLTSLACGASKSADLADACGHGGVALAIAHASSRAPVYRASGRVFIPPEMLNSAGLSSQAWLEHGPDARHDTALRAFADFGREHLTKARAAIAKLKSDARAPFMALATTETILVHAGSGGMAPTRRADDLSPLRRQFIFLRAALRGMP